MPLGDRRVRIILATEGRPELPVRSLLQLHSTADAAAMEQVLGNFAALVHIEYFTTVDTSCISREAWM